MARIRTIKPEFFTDAALGECSTTARLAFVASWVFADDNGNLERSSKQLKAQAFPYDHLDVEPLLLELLARGCLIEYEVGGKKYMHIKGFERHQRIDKKSSPRYPLFDESKSTPLVLGEPSRLKGREKERSNTTAGRSRDTATPDGFEVFWKAYPKRAGGNPKQKALRAYRARIGEGHAPAEMLDGVGRYARFLSLTGKAGTEFVQQAATFLGPDKLFLEPWSAPNGGTRWDASNDGILAKARELGISTRGESTETLKQQIRERMAA